MVQVYIATIGTICGNLGKKKRKELALLLIVLYLQSIQTHFCVSPWSLIANNMVHVRGNLNCASYSDYKDNNLVLDGNSDKLNLAFVDMNQPLVKETFDFELLERQQ